MGDFDWNDVLLEFHVSTKRPLGDYTDLFQYLRDWHVDAVAVDEEERPIERVGWASGTVVDLESATAADAHVLDLFEDEWDSTHIREALLLSGLLDDIIGDPERVNQGLLALQRVYIEPPYRSVGLGPLLAAVALTELRAGCCVAACAPAPFEPDIANDPARRAAEIERLGRIWSTVGFRPLKDGVWALDLDTDDLPAHRMVLHKSFVARSGY